MKKQFLLCLVAAIGLPCAIVSFSSCSQEDRLGEMEIPAEEYGSGSRTRTIYYSPYTKYTFMLHADHLQNGTFQSDYIADLFDISILISPVMAGIDFVDGACPIEFKTHPEGFPPDNYIEFRFHECHYDPTVVRPCISYPVNMVLERSVSATDEPLTDWEFENSVVAVRLTKKRYLTKMNVKSQLLISRKPLSELVTFNSNKDEVCIHIYYNCNEANFYHAIEYNEDNPPVFVFKPGATYDHECTIGYANGTDSSFYFLRTLPVLPEYDATRDNSYKWLREFEEFNKIPVDSMEYHPDYERLYPFRDYYKTPCVVPQWYHD